MKKHILFISLALAGLVLNSCSENFLLTEPQGSTLTENQYQKLDDAVEGSIMGIYSRLYQYGGEHDEFGQRSIDMYADLLSGDMAMNTATYGWFQSDEMGLSYQYRSGYIFSYFYNIIRLCNNCVNAVKAQGYPSIPEEGKAPDESEWRRGFYYGQVLALRGWAYAGLMRYYAYPKKVLDQEVGADEAEDYPSIMLYDEVDAANPSNLGNPRSSVAEAYDFIDTDLRTAIEYLDVYGQYVERKNKLEINADVARGIRAYALINRDTPESYTQALKVAKEIIDGGKFRILPNANLLTTGFADVNEASWMWGQDVTVETSTQLASFWGQVDIHTYSYAQAGDVKGIDDKLYSDICDMKWDGRRNWWRAKNPYQYAPDGKFFNPTTKNTTSSSEVDRNWLCDNVYMRIESIYLIAAEACVNKTTPSLDSAAMYLGELLDQRLDTTATAATELAAYKATLTTVDALKNAIRYNWRVEMWGEGYGMQTLRRTGESNQLGKNHLREDSYVNASGTDFTFRIPTSETRYNPALKTTELVEDKN